MSNIVRQVAVLSSYNSKATVSLQIVCQVTLFPSYNSKATVSLLCSLPIPILFQFILIYLNLFWIYLNFVEVFEWIWVKREDMWKVELCASAITPIFGLMYIVDKVFIQASGLACEVYVKVSLLRFLPTMVCEVADSVVCQVAMLSSFNSL